jgi:hypothetical protein
MNTEISILKTLLDDTFYSYDRLSDRHQFTLKSQEIGTVISLEGFDF